MKTSSAEVAAAQTPVRSDCELLCAARAGDRAAFAEFAQRYTRALFRFCYGRLRDSHLAEDAAQEALLRMYRGLRGLDLSNPGGWLFGIARRICQETLRGRAPAVSLEQASGVAAAQGSMESDEAIEALLAALDDQQRHLVYLKHVTGLSCGEIAQQTQQPLGTVTSALARAYRKLREAGRR